MKNIYKNSIANIKFNGDKFDASPLRSGTEHECPLSPRLSNTVLEVLANAVRQKQGYRASTGWVGRNKIVSVCRWEIV